MVKYVHSHGQGNCCYDEVLFMPESLRNTFLDLFIMTFETLLAQRINSGSMWENLSVLFVSHHAISNYKTLLFFRMHAVLK